MARSYVGDRPEVPAATITGIVAALSLATTPPMTQAPPAPVSYLYPGYRPINAGTLIWVGLRPQTNDPVSANYKPRTALGRRLLDLRRAFIADGGRLLSWEEIDAEVRERRGGLADD